MLRVHSPHQSEGQVEDVPVDESTLTSQQHTQHLGGEGGTLLPNMMVHTYIHVHVHVCNWCNEQCVHDIVHVQCTCIHIVHCVYV